MSPTESKNTAPAPKKQARQTDEERNLAHQLEAKVLNHLRVAIRYADLAEQHYEIYDNFGFDRCIQQFVDHSKDIANTMKKLRNLKGVTE
jgi:hypothetical protein